MHGLSLSATQNATLVAVCDIRPERAKQKAEQFGCEKWYSDVAQMLEKENLDVVHICAPHDLHAPLAIQAMEAGVHVITEKPMATTCEDARKMLETAKRTGKTLAVISQNRWNPGAVLIKEKMEDHSLGKLLGLRGTVAWFRNEQYYTSSDWKGTWAREGGGVIINQAYHTIDMLRYIAGEEVDYIDANIANRFHPYIEVEDSAEGVIVFKSGIHASFQTITYNTIDAQVEMEFYWENATARMEGSQATIKMKDGTTFESKDDDGEAYQFGGKSYWGVSHIKQIRAFYDALEKGQPFMMSGEEAYKTQQMVEAVYRSGKEHQKIYI